MSIIKVLIHAKQIISKPENWIKIDNAVDSLGNVVSPSDSLACKFCIIGAIERANHELNIPRNHKLLAAVRERIPENYYFISTFNDDVATSHSDVMSLFDRVIEDNT